MSEERWEPTMELRIKRTKMPPEPDRPFPFSMQGITNTQTWTLELQQMEVKRGSKLETRWKAIQIVGDEE